MQSVLGVAEASGTWGRINGKGIVSHSVGTGFSRERRSSEGFQAWVTISSGVCLVVEDEWTEQALDKVTVWGLAGAEKGLNGGKSSLVERDKWSRRHV